MNKEIKRILIALSLFAFAGGFFYNFQQLWMMENNLSLKTIGTVLSLGALISVSTIFLCSNLIKQNRLKNFINLLLLIKVIIYIVLFCLNYSGHNIIIKFLTIVDYAVDVEIYASIYPLISLITKDDKLYAKRRIYYVTFYYIGVLITGLILGKSILNLTFSYNIYLLISAIFTFASLLVLINTNIEKYYKKEDKTENKNDILFKLLKKIKRDKISKNYLLFILLGDIGFNIINSLLILILTQHIGFTPRFTSNFILVLGILSVILATIILEKMTFKNNYINLSIKFVVRLIIFTIAVLVGNKWAYLIAIIYLLLTCEWYTHVTHAPYINRFNGDYQFAFSNLNEIVSYLARSVGTLLCSTFIGMNLRYIFILVVFFTTFQIIFAFKALKLKNEESVIND